MSEHSLLCGVTSSVFCFSTYWLGKFREPKCLQVAVWMSKIGFRIFFFFWQKLFTQLICNRCSSGGVTNQKIKLSKVMIPLTSVSKSLTTLSVFIFNTPWSYGDVILFLFDLVETKNLFHRSLKRECIIFTSVSIILPNCWVPSSMHPAPLTGVWEQQWWVLQLLFIFHWVFWSAFSPLIWNSSALYWYSWTETH